MVNNSGTVRLTDPDLWACHAPKIEEARFTALLSFTTLRVEPSPTVRRPAMATMQKEKRPSATTTSTSEKADVLKRAAFTGRIHVAT